jgi:hypothetical protein
MEVK